MERRSEAGGSGARRAAAVADRGSQRSRRMHLVSVTLAAAQPVAGPKTCLATWLVDIAQC